MTNQDLIDLAHSNLKKYSEQEYTTQPRDAEYSTIDMLAFHKQGIREGLALILKDLFDPEDKELLEEDQFGYHLLAIQEKYQDLVPKPEKPISEGTRKIKEALGKFKGTPSSSQSS
jgi:hypothetical protein